LLFPYTTLFRSVLDQPGGALVCGVDTEADSTRQSPQHACPGGCHPRLPDRSQRQSQAIRLGQVSRRHYRQHRSLCSTNFWDRTLVCGAKLACLDIGELGTTGTKGLPGKVASSHTHLSREGLCVMLRDRVASVDLFALVPALQLHFEPELAELDRLLEDDELFQHIKADLSRRRPHTTETGRPSTPVEVILRLLVVQHLYDWSYAQTEHFVGDSLVLRQFCRLGLEPMPHHT